MVQAAQAQHAEELASHTSAYTKLYTDIVDAKKQLEQQAESMACLQTELTRVTPLHILLYATPFSLSCVLTMLPCRSVPFVLNRRLAVSQACISSAV